MITTLASESDKITDQQMLVTSKMTVKFLGLLASVYFSSEAVASFTR